jgi:trigger factor
MTERPAWVGASLRKDMSPTIETLGALERRIHLTVPAAELEREVTARLTKLARSLKMPGFRPGKVPLKMVAASYGAQVHSEVLNDKLGAAFNAAVTANNLRVAGTPRLEAEAATGAGELAFAATFEVLPEVRIGDLSSLRIERPQCPVGDVEIDKTIEIMRRQRARYEPVERAAADGDRVTVDFVGSIDGAPFAGGSGSDVPFTLGQGRMLPEFEAAVRGMRAGERKTFSLTFPSDYRATELAGKQASFEVTVKRVEEAQLPPVDSEFARALGVADGDLAKMRAEIKANLEREVAARLRSRTREAVMQALSSVAQFELPKSLVAAEQQRLAEMARADLAARGVATEGDAALAPELFVEQAQRRVRLGLIIAEIVRSQRLQARQEQIRKAIEEIAQSYEKPSEVIQWYLSNRERLAELESAVTEDNVIGWVLQQAQTVPVAVAFDELMGPGR